jgi:subtilisin family serine protease
MIRRAVAAALFVQGACWAFGGPAEARESYLVKFAPWVRDTAQRVESVGGRIDRYFPEIRVHVVSVVDGADFKKAARQREIEFEYAEPNLRVSVDSRPNDRFYSRQGRLGEIKPERAWKLTRGSPDVLIAVSDTGVDLEHPDLVNRIWKNPREISGNGIDDDGNGFIDDVQGWDFHGDTAVPDDGNGHGTHVAGIIGAEGDNRIGITGVNWDVRILPVKFLGADGSGTLEGGIASMLYAHRMGARVINASWGTRTRSQAMNDAIEYIFQHDGLVVAAAGNRSADTDSWQNSPSAESSLGVISVASSSQPGVLSLFSNTGQLTVDLAAPGERVFSTFYRDGYESLSGTSMAAPMVSGIAGLILSLRPELTAIQLRNAILNAVSISDATYRYRLATAGDADASRAVSQLSQDLQIWPRRLTIESGSTYPLTAWAARGPVTWSVMPEGGLVIDSEGRATAHAEGNYRVIARDGAGRESELAEVRVAAPTRSTVGCSSPSKLPISDQDAGGFAFSMIGLPGLAAWVGTRRRKRR